MPNIPYLFVDENSTPFALTYILFCCMYITTLQTIKQASGHVLHWTKLDFVNIPIRVRGGFAIVLKRELTDITEPKCENKKRIFARVAQRGKGAICRAP